MVNKDITSYELHSFLVPEYHKTEPATFLSVEVNHKSIYEIHLKDLFKKLFSKDGALYKYYTERHTSYIDLYNDLESMGYDTKTVLAWYINTTTTIHKPFPIEWYPSVLRYYENKASYKDLIIVDMLLEGLTPKDVDRGNSGDSFDNNEF